jgi:hypothetical protein
VIYSMDWKGQKRRDLFTGPEDLREYLKALPVSHIAIDQSAPESERALLEQALAGDPIEFRLRSRWPVTGQLPDRHGDILIYENLAAAGRKPSVIEINFGPDHGNRILKYIMR